MTKMTFQRVTERDVGISMEEAASRLGLPSNTDPDQVRLAARMAGFPVDMIRPSKKETRNSLLMELSSYAGGMKEKKNLDELKQHPSWSSFERRAKSAGLDPAKLVHDRNQNIGDYESGGFAKRVGKWMDKTGLDDVITYGTIAAAGAGAATAFGGAATTAGTGSSGASGTFAGSSPALAPVSIPNVATAAPTTVAAGGATTGTGAAAALPASVTSLEMASLPTSISAITGSSAGAVMQPFPEGASRIADLARSDAGGFLSRAGGWLRANPEIVGSVISGVGQGIAANQASENRLETERALIQERTAAEQSLMRFQKDLVDENYAGTDPGRKYQSLSRGSSGVSPTERFKFDFSPSEGKMIRVPKEVV